MMVSLIQSNYMGFGSGVVVPGTGISLQNRGAGFSLEPATERGRRRQAAVPHDHSGFLTSDGAPLAAFGVMGGPIQPQGHVQTLVRMLLARQNPQAASTRRAGRAMRGLTSRSRARCPLMSSASCGGAATASPAATTATWTSARASSSGASAIRHHGYVAASDSRRDGLAAGY